jgi:hypothetical protein
MKKLLVTFHEILVSYDKVADINDLIERLITFAHRRKYKNKKVGGDTLVIQKSGTWRMLTGLSANLRISVSIEQGKTEVIFCDYFKEYVLKLIVFVIAFLISPTLFLSISHIFWVSNDFWISHTAYPLPIFLILSFPVYGAFRQYRLMEDIKAEIDDYFSCKIGKAD